jgi:asparagine synthase (glutamine-hydrolysing)
MCGIAGWSLVPGARRDAIQLTAMANAIAHRGPDDRGYFVDPERGIALANNRLSIIDLSRSGHQPMLNDNGGVVLVYNGELYNFRDLRKELEQLGHRFQSRTDTEVVLHSFLEWGSASVQRFCGMFAFAIWVAAEDRLLLARDPLGIKPLYFASLPGGQGLAFASEIKAFSALPDLAMRANHPAVHQFLEFGYTFDDDATALEGVSKVPPGHTLEVVNGSPGVPIPYFTPPYPEAGGHTDIQGWEEQLHEVLSKVVAEHLVADVPVGVLLSGGIDSSLIAALAAKHARVATISMAFADSEIDERAFARKVSNHIASTHSEVIIHPKEVTESIEEVAACFDDLFADWGTVSTRLLYKKCREQGIKVALVGEGADELFGGYAVFQAAKECKGATIWQLFQLYRRYAGRRYGSQFPRFLSVMRRYLDQSHGDMFHAVRLFESRNQLPNNYVMKVDKASMSVSVEARAPFLDRRLAELAYQIPSKFLLAAGTNKYLLRSMAERYELLPREITRRPKFGASMATSWMDQSQDFRSYAREIILDPSGWVDELGLRNAMTDYFMGKRAGYRFPRAISLFGNLAWKLLLLNLWSRQYSLR